jgi:hypothetical protein
LGILEWLPQDFQHAAAKLRQFVEEQYAVMCQTDLPRPRNGAPTDESSVRGRVVWRPERARRHQCPLAVQQPGNTVDLRCFNRFFKAHVWENGWETTGQERFP